MSTSQVGELFTVCWTEDILAETIYSIRRSYPHLEGGALSALRERVESAFADGRIRDYRPDPGFSRTDINDAHVHAAAIACDASYVVTNDRKGLVPADGQNLPYEIYTADEFLVLVDGSAPEIVFEVAMNQFRYFMQRNQHANLPLALRRAGAPEFARRVAKHLRAAMDSGQLVERAADLSNS
ncbi:PIN domain-containing protein [Micrococcales bacterium 31B]|nr:PIN domain-containing protein [Micrococcales bacterium 31B]